MKKASSLFTISHRSVLETHYHAMPVSGLPYGCLQPMGLFFGKMQTTQKENVQVQGILNVQVSHDLIVKIIPNSEHKFLMTTTDVAIGYGVSYESVKKNMLRHADELKEEHHFIKGVNLIHTQTTRSGQLVPSLPKGLQPNAYYWTKEGVIRLGFFIKSTRAKQFRDWAEGVIMDVIAPKMPILAPKRKTANNRLTPQRLIDILSDVCQIEDSKLRLSLLAKLKGGVAL